MRYALVDKRTAEERGFDPKLHRITSDGRMVINENELMMIDPSPAAAAESLNVIIMSESEVFNELKKCKK